MADSQELTKARASLDRIQKFDTTSLSREQQLGQDYNFVEAIEPATRIVTLLRQFPIEFLDELPIPKLNIIISCSDAIYNQFNEILRFDAKRNDAYNARQVLINNLRNSYNDYFDQMYSLISYGSSRQRDFDAMERSFRATMQKAEDEAAELNKKLLDTQQGAERTLEEVRKLAAEHGVSQQAIYFQNESIEHQRSASTWRNATIASAISLGIFAILMVFTNKLEWIAPSDTYQAVQLSLSKVIVFAVLGYILVLCARNFLAHTHNVIINRHRQNALLTFNALVDAAGSNERRDVILTYAAACIFSPQDTGYTKSVAGGSGEMPLNIIQAIPKIASATGHG